MGLGYDGGSGTVGTGRGALGHVSGLGPHARGWREWRLGGKQGTNGRKQGSGLAAGGARQGRLEGGEGGGVNRI